MMVIVAIIIIIIARWTTEMSDEVCASLPGTAKEKVASAYASRGRSKRWKIAVAPGASKAISAVRCRTARFRCL